MTSPETPELPEKAEKMQLAPSTEKAEILQQTAKEAEEEKLKQVAAPTDKIEVLSQEAEILPEEEVNEQLAAPTDKIEVLSQETEMPSEGVNEHLAAPTGEIDVVAAEIPIELDDNVSSEEVPEVKVHENLPPQKPNKGNLLVKPDIIPRQKPKSGKFWKAERSQFRAIKKDRGPRLTFQQRVKR